MGTSLKAGVAFLAIATGLTALPATVPLANAGALDALPGVFSDSRRDAKRRQQAAAEEAARQRAAAAAQQTSQAAPVKRITGPQYYTYKPDQEIAVDFGAIADPVTTAGVSLDGFSPLGIDPFAEGRSALETLSISALPEVAEAMVDWYSRKPAYLWIGGTAPSAKADAVLSVLADARGVGLDPADYAVARPGDAFDVTQGTSRQQDLMAFEMRLTAAVLTYALDATRGRVDPNRLSGYHDFKRKSPDLGALLAELANSSEPAVALQGKNPQGAHFAALMAELQRLDGVNEGPRIDLPGDLILKPGQENEHLTDVVESIRRKGSDALKADHALVLASYAGKPGYDDEIADMVKAFQKEAGLTPDGIIGPATVRALTGDSLDEKRNKVIYAMERARWLPGTFAPRRVFINQPAFTATYYKDGKADLSMRVVVGTKANQTYFFDDVIETVEVNPYWGVPQSILVNEMLPKLRRDPSYLDRLGYEVTYKGRAVSSSSISWGSIGSGAGIGVRQPPSGDNALGELKILFPNTHAIYMHDTPARSLFERDTRAYSHGCIRLHDPRAMAAAVLGTTREDIGREISGGRNKAIPVSEGIPVHVAYFTAWPDDAGTVHYYGDVYGRDDYLGKAIDATETARTGDS